MSAGGSTKVILVSLMANMGIALSKLAAALVTGSASMMAEAVHSFSDCGNQVLLLYGNHVAKKPANPKYPLGRGKETFFWSFVVALMLFSLGGLFSIYEGVEKLSHLAALSYPVVGILVLSIAIGLESYSFLVCVREVRADPGFRNFRQWIRETTRADLLVLFLEDSAALLGLVIAFIMLGLAWITGDPFWDGVGSITIGVLLIAMALILAREVKSLLIGEAPVKEYAAPIAALLDAVMPGARMLNMIVLQQGIDAVLIAYKIHLNDAEIGAEVAARKVNVFEARVKEAFPEVRWQFTEIDVAD